MLTRRTFLTHVSSCNSWLQLAGPNLSNVLDSGEIVQFLASIGRPEFLEVFMQSDDLNEDGNIAFQQNYDSNKDGNIAFQEAKRLTPTADAKNVSD